MLKNRGILLIAFGHPYYGRMAYNLAVSIRVVDSEIPIAIYCTKGVLSHIREENLNVFSSRIEVEPGGQDFGTKLDLDLISPFEETLFIDVDTLWLPSAKSPSALMDSIGDHDWAIITEGRWNIGTGEDDSHKAYFYWADREEIKKAYNLSSGFLYQSRSEVVFFRKTDRVKALFEAARDIYKNNSLKSKLRFGNSYPDELAFNIAMAVTGVEPFEYKWCPSYWSNMRARHVPVFTDLVKEGFFLVSFGGHTVDGTLKRAYDKIMGIACRKLGRQHLFSLHSKTNFAPERRKKL